MLNEAISAGVLLVEMFIGAGLMMILRHYPLLQECVITIALLIVLWILPSAAYRLSASSELAIRTIITGIIVVLTSCFLAA